MRIVKWVVVAIIIVVAMLYVLEALGYKGTPGPREFFQKVVDRVKSWFQDEKGEKGARLESGAFECTRAGQISMAPLPTVVDFHVSVKG